MSTSAIALDAGWTTGVYEGQYWLAFETSRFTPTDSNKGGPWWLTGDLGPTFADEARTKPHPWVAPVYLKVRGQLSPDGRYGHMGIYTRELVVERVLEVRWPDKASLTRDAEAKKDYKVLVRFIRQLARAGDRNAALELGEIYRTGRPGIPRDLGESLYWDKQARELGAPSR